MWNHFCETEKTVLSVEDGAPCNWCDARADTKPRVMVEGQGYVDEPMMLLPKTRSYLSMAVGDLFGSRPARELCAGFNRIRLRWMKPDGHGGLTPK